MVKPHHRVADAEQLAARACGLAQRFGDALRAGDAAAAQRAVDDALASGTAPEAIHALVVEPAMTRIGELWERNVIDVADEHLATAISQRSLIRLFETMSRRRVRERSRERVLLAAVEGQHHVLGLRMIADVLEGAGFDVLYLGEDVPVESLRASVMRHGPAVVGLAFGFAADVGPLADSLWAIHESAPETRIMLGGNAVPHVLRDAAYPHVASSMEVVAVVDALLASPPARLPVAVDALRTDGTRRTRARGKAPADAIAESLARAPDDAAGLFDIDDLKSVNAEQGPDAGHRPLQAVGEAITASIRPSDVAARSRADDSAPLPGATTDVAQEIGDRVRAAVAGRGAPVSLSVGVAALSGDARGTLLAAEGTVYAAKRRDGGRVVAAEGDQPVAGGEAIGPVYVSMSRLAIPAERAPELVTAFRNRSRLADRADGFVDLQVWQSDRDPGEIVMVSRWRDRDAFKAYMKSAEHKVSHDRIDPDLKQDIALRRLEHLHTYEVVSE